MDFESVLKASFEKRLTEFGTRAPDHLAESIRYSLLAPGKRIRPRLVMAASEMLGLPATVAASAAAALEMIHCYTLIHDDLPCMDNDDMRRGRPSNHKKFGESLALLAGDALIPMAFSVLCETHDQVAPQAFARALKRLSWAAGAAGAVGGQAAESLLGKDSTLGELRSMHDQKTGALFMAALLIPKDLSGLEDDSTESLALEAFSRELGAAFQVIDDLEDAAEEKSDPTSILFYLPDSEVRKMTRQKLKAATESLTSIWTERSGPLIEISEELLHKLQGNS